MFAINIPVSALFKKVWIMIYPIGLFAEETFPFFKDKNLYKVKLSTMPQSFLYGSFLYNQLNPFSRSLHWMMLLIHFPPDRQKKQHYA